MDGGTVFHFVTEGIETALKLALKSANGKDVRLGGGVSVIQQYLKARLIDEMHIAVSPVFLGAGERLFENINLNTLGYKLVKTVMTEKAMHLTIAKS
jgi:dihydrofolate reductase